MQREIKKKYGHNCIYYTGGKHNREVKRVDLPPLHPALEKFSLPPGHPGYPGKGLRVTQRVPKDTPLGTYGGVFINAIELGDTTPFTFEVDHGAGVEALHHGNLLRYVNDPRGTGRAANVRVEDVFVGPGRVRLVSVEFITRHDIEAGEELFIHYGSLYDFTMHSPPIGSLRVEVDLDLVPVKREPGLELTMATESQTNPTEPESKEEPQTKKLKQGQWEGDCECGCDLLDDPESEEKKKKGFKAPWYPRCMAEALTLHVMGQKFQAAECQVLLDVLKAHPRYACQQDCVKLALQEAVFLTLRRTRYHRGLSKEDELMYADLRETYDPLELITCVGPCGRRLKRSHFGLIRETILGIQWPPCSDCVAPDKVE